MTTFRTLPWFAFAVFVAGQAAVARPPAAIPHLSREHGATQLVVDGKPFLTIGGELENSSASSRVYMKPVWPKLAAMHFNTVLAPVSWELIEPQEGKFDFRSVDELIADARNNKMHLVLLWFGSWKNGGSSYVPAWVKRDEQRFPRVVRSDGRGLEVLSAVSTSNLDADIRAFTALMKHIKATDGVRHTVIMVQPENEVGLQPEARDHSPAADAVFAAPVPAQLTDYLKVHVDTLVSSLREAWQSHGAKVGASWEDTFGAGPATDELFNAWSEALYTGKVAAAGKAIYPLPMFVNAALIRPGRQPGQYPSGGPLPHLFDVWHAAAPSIDMLSPDLYFSNFQEWASKYARPDNPYFIPETGRTSGSEMGANAFWAIAQLNAMGFSPYAPEYLSVEDQKALGGTYLALQHLAPEILAAQGTGRMVGVRPPSQYDGTVDLSARKFAFGHYVLDVHFKDPPSWVTPSAGELEMAGTHGGLIIQTTPDEFLVAGSGMVIYFETTGVSDPEARADAIWEELPVSGRWLPGRRLNGDLTYHGQHLRLPPGEFGIYHLRLYHYH